MRRFLFLQGPHGPFFDELARDLRAARQEVVRIGFNPGDAHYWSDPARYLRYAGASEDWAAWLDGWIDRAGITDIVLYGDMRPVHRTAVQAASARGLRVHCFEEGYLRPYWITYERGGTNGNSRLMRMALPEILAGEAADGMVHADAPAIWGALWPHTWYGCMYHANILFRNGAYPRWRTHRETGVLREWLLHVQRLAAIPAHMAGRQVKTFRLMRSGRPYHVALLQLGHDSAIRHHSPIRSMSEFIRTTVAAFAQGAPGHHLLVFKAHPLEDGREPLRRVIREAAVTAGIAERVVYIEGGKLGPLLDRATSAVTVNSTAGQQVLWRGLPLKLLGSAIYDKPEFVSAKPLAEFFAAPDRPDLERYRAFRQYLLETSQVAGGFYTARARANARRVVVDLMLQERDPYDMVRGRIATARPKLELVRGGTLDR